MNAEMQVAASSPYRKLPSAGCMGTHPQGNWQSLTDRDLRKEIKMEQMKEINELLDNIIICGENIARIGRLLKEMKSTEEVQPQAEATKTEVPAEALETTPAEPIEKEEVPAKTYSFADVRKLCSALSHKGHTAKVKELISKYGAAKLSEIREEDYPALMADLEVI